MRMMSFALTEPQLMDGSKTVTRRTGWAELTPGTVLATASTSWAMRSSSLRSAPETFTPIGLLTPVAGKLSGQFVIHGTQLGGPKAAIYAALYRQGKSQVLLEPIAGGSDTTLTFTVSDAQALPADPAYRVILRVNGVQALDSPVLSWT